MNEILVINTSNTNYRLLIHYYIFTSVKETYPRTTFSFVLGYPDLTIKNILQISFFNCQINSSTFILACLYVLLLIPISYCPFFWLQDTVPRVYFARDYIFSTVPTKFFAHIPAYFLNLMFIYLFIFFSCVISKGKKHILKDSFLR